MATVVDSLILTLGLDPSGFNKGQKEAAKSLLDTADKTKKAGADMSKSIRGVMGEFIALFLTVRGISDVSNWFKGLNDTLAELGYSSKNIGQSASDLRTWQQVAEQMGGTAEGVNNTIQTLNQSLFNKQFHGQISQQLEDLIRLGVQIKTNAQGVVDYHALMDDLADRMRTMPRVQAFNLLSEAGFDTGSINAILSGRKAVDTLYNREQATARQTASGANAAQQLQRAWNDLRFALTGIGAQILKQIEPTLEEIFRGIAGWFGKHQGDISSGIKQLLGWASGDGPKNLVHALAEVADAALSMAKAVNALFPSSTGASEQAGEPDSDSSAWGVVKGSVKRAFAREKIADIAHKYGIPVGALTQLGAGTDLEKAAAQIAAAHKKMSPNDTSGKSKQDKQEDWLYGSDLMYQYGADPDKISKEWQDAVDVLRMGGPIQNAAKLAKGVAPTPGTSARPGAASGPRASGTAGNAFTIDIGNVTINTKATDASGIAQDFATQVRQKMDVALADTGLQ